MCFLWQFVEGEAKGEPFGDLGIINRDEAELKMNSRRPRAQQESGKMLGTESRTRAQGFRDGGEGEKESKRRREQKRKW